MQIGNEILAYREGGEGDRTLILVHGNMSSSLHFDQLMLRLKDDFKIYAPDLRGFGHSSYHERFDSLKTLSEDLEHFVEKLRLKDFELLGWSTGGGICMQFAADNPDLVKRLVLVESVGIMGYPINKKDASGMPIPDQFLMTKEEVADDPIQVKPVLDALEAKDGDFYKALWNAAIYNLGNIPKPELYEQYVAEMLLQRNLVDIDYALMYFNISDESNVYGAGTGDVNRIQCEADIIQGKDDLVVPASMGEGIYKALAPKATYHNLDKCGHNPMVDQLDELVRIIKK
jgi:pimeloyl-ACP methyl ester carboxylesterase